MKDGKKKKGERTQCDKISLKCEKNSASKLKDEHCSINKWMASDLC